MRTHTHLCTPKDTCVHSNFQNQLNDVIRGCDPSAGRAWRSMTAAMMQGRGDLTGAHALACTSIATGTLTLTHTPTPISTQTLTHGPLPHTLPSVKNWHPMHVHRLARACLEGSCPAQRRAALLIVVQPHSVHDEARQAPGRHRRGSPNVMVLLRVQRPGLPQHHERLRRVL